MATSAASETIASLEKDPKTTAGVSSASWISRNKPGSLVGQSMDEVMSVSESKLPAVVAVTNPGVGVTVYRIDQIRQPTSMDAKVYKAQAQQIQALAAQSEFAGFMAYWRNGADVKVINPLKQASSGS
jgi:hypothetical protein